MIRQKKIGCLELLNHYLDRTNRYNPALNAIIATDIPRAKKRAKAADKALAAGEVWGPLHGVPMTVKESHQVAGLPTTWGIPELAGSVTQKDGLTVQRWTEAGANVFGKTNVPLTLGDFQTWNEIYGDTNNPWDLTRGPGGSSGGAAAALATGLTAIEMGSDIASSIRNPAHFCGIFGHKPTWGLCPPRGHAVGDNVSQTDISVVGPLARHVDDLELGLSIMAGPDEIDAAGYKLRLKPSLKKNLGDFKVAFMDDWKGAPVEAEIKDLLNTLARWLRRQGTKIDSKARPAFDIDDAQRTYDLMLSAAMMGRADDATFDQLLALKSTFNKSDDHYMARFAMGSTLHHRDWLALNEKRHQLRWKWHEFFKKFDVMLMPVLCTAAFPPDRKPVTERFSTINGKKYPAVMEFFWAGFSGLSYLPATVAPIGFTKSGLPVGVQIVAPQFGDRTSIHFARLLEREYQAFKVPPGFE